MVQHRIIIGDEEKRILRSIALNSPAVKKRRTASNIISFAFAALLIGSAVYSFAAFRSTDNLVFVGAFAALFLLLGLGGNKLLQRFSLKRAMKKLDGRLNSGVREYIFSNEGVELFSEFGNAKINLSALKAKGEIEHYLYVRLIDGRLLLIDKNKTSAAELDELNKLLGNIVKD